MSARSALRIPASKKAAGPLPEGAMAMSPAPESVTTACPGAGGGRGERSESYGDKKAEPAHGASR